MVGKRLTLEDVRASYRSQNFLMTMTRLFAVKADHPEVEVRLHRQCVDPPIMDWIHEKQTESRNDAEPYFFLISSELNPDYWNRAHYDLFLEYLSHPQAYPGFSMKALTGPYVAVSTESLPPEAPAKVSVEGEAMGNNLFSLFYQAALNNDRRFSLSRLDRRLTCHWAACGGALAILDLYPVSEGNLVRNRVGSTVCVEGPATVILDFVENEYNTNLINAVDTSVFAKLLLGEDGCAGQKRIPRNACDYGYVELEPGEGDLAPVFHQGASMYRAGNFYLATPDNIVRATNSAWGMRRSPY